MSWRLQKLAILLGTLLALCGVAAAWMAVAPSTDAAPEPYAPTDRVSSARDQSSPQTILTPEQIAAVGKVDLRRMSQPKPPPEPTPQPTDEPPAPYQFSGVLIGTLVDSDPASSYAVIRRPDNVVRLVRQGAMVDETAADVQVTEVSRDHITVRHLPTETVAKVEVSRP